VFFFLVSLQSGAEYKTNVHSISRREGLSNGAVNTIVKDAEGYIWFGTWNGLNRYDGSTISTYLPANNPASIHNHVIRELYPSRSGPVWMLTNKGIALYDNIHDRFTSFFARESDQINYETDIAIGFSEGFGTLASVTGRGIFRYDSTIRDFEKIVFEAASQASSVNIRRIHMVEKDAYCLTVTGQLMKIAGDRLDPIMQLPLTGDLTSSVSVMISGRPCLLITRRTSPAIMVDLETRNFQLVKVPDDVITSFAVSQDQSRVWAGTEKGVVYSCNLPGLNFEVFNRLSGVINNNPIATRILCIYESEPDILWIGTDGNGVYTLKLTEFPNRVLSSDQLAYPIVRSLLVTRRGDLLIGTKGGGIDIFDINGNHIRGITVKNGLSNNSVLSFHERSDGSIWVGTDGQGVDILSPDYRTIRNFPRDFKNDNPFGFASVYRILEDSDQRLYLGTSGYGVILVDFDKSHLSLPLSYEQLILDRGVDASRQKQIVYALTEERPGVIWIGTRGVGVYRYNTITKRVMAQYSTLSHPDLIKNDDILSLFTEPGGNIWVGSSNGMFSMVPLSADSIRVEVLSNQADLSNTSIHTIQIDHTGNLWATTNLGLTLINKGKNNIRSFNANDGLINFEYSDGASFFDRKNGRLYVGGTMGVDIILTDEIRYSSYFPPLGINQLLIRNLPVISGQGSVLTGRVNHQKSLILNYNQNSITFDVSALAFWGQERHRISYRLINSDDEWVTRLQNQPVSFSNLKPGHYRLDLRVSDENGNWPEKVREMAITINPPFWLTPWAIGAYILLAIGIQLLIFSSYRRREARKKETVLLEFQKNKEEELHRYKIEFFTHVAHEFRTPLTLISSHIHTLLEDSRNTVENPRLLKIFNNSIKLQKLVLEIMQFRKLEIGKEPLNIRMTKPVELIREVLSDLELFAQQRDIHCEIIASDPECSFKTDPDKFQRIMTNLISNAIKYNRQGGYVKALVQGVPSALTVVIVDNGVGIPPEYISKVFEPFGISSARKKGSFPGYRSTGLGIAVTKGLVELMKGTIRVDSLVDEGTRFTCYFPDVHQLTETEFIKEPVDEYNEFSFIDDIGSVENMEISDPTSDKPVILLVDDDPEILSVLKDFLHSDYHLLFAENGLEAYSKIETAKPDLIVSDVMMPVMDGIELCRKIRENFDTSHLPVILLAAKGEMEDRIAGLNAGADSYIPKPFHPDHLKIRITNLLQVRASIMSHFGNQDYNHSLVKQIPDPFFQKLLNFIDENIDDTGLSSEKLCDKLAISKSSLYNKTRSVLGTTPHSLIYQRRLSKAAILLQSTVMTVSEIIDQTGFASRTHFYELFNKAYNCSPSDYRNKPVDHSMN
jgi:signal transduction histidine kinase/CheY-like chemotaxis protein/ligand-binding sensor domain-containing protein